MPQISSRSAQARTLRDIWHKTKRPLPGMPITIFTAGDRYPGTIVAVSPSEHRFSYRKDAAITTDDHTPERQSYLYIPDPESQLEVATRCADGHYQVARCPWTCVALGARSLYFDPALL